MRTKAIFGLVLLLSAATVHAAERPFSDVRQLDRQEPVIVFEDGPEGKVANIYRVTGTHPDNNAGGKDSDVVELSLSSISERPKLLELPYAKFYEAASRGELIILQRASEKDSLSSLIIYSGNGGYLDVVQELWTSPKGYQIAQLTPVSDQPNFLLIQKAGLPTHDLIKVRTGQRISEAALAAGKILTTGEVSEKSLDVIRIEAINGMSPQAAHEEFEATQAAGGLPHADHALCPSLFSGL